MRYLKMIINIKQLSFKGCRIEGDQNINKRYHKIYVVKSDPLCIKGGRTITRIHKFRVPVSSFYQNTRGDCCVDSGVIENVLSNNNDNRMTC
jgi:hypothetical protein